MSQRCIARKARARDHGGRVSSVFRVHDLVAACVNSGIELLSHAMYYERFYKHLFKSIEERMHMHGSAASQTEIPEG